MNSLSILNTKNKITCGVYVLPNPLRSVEDLIRLNCWDLAGMDSFGLWQERERVKAALVFIDPENPGWIFAGVRCISAVDWLVNRLEAIGAEEGRRKKAGAVL